MSRILLTALCLSVLAMPSVRAAEGETKTFDAVIVRAEATVHVAAPVSGLVTLVPTSVNDTIEADELLVQLDDREAELAVLQATEELRRAEASIDKARALLARAKNNAKHRLEDLQRYEQIGGSASDAELRKLREATENADIDHVLAYSEYEQTQKLAEIAAVRLKAAELNRSKLRITAPSSGVVTSIMASVGENVSPGETMLEIRALESMLADLFLPEASTDLTKLLGKSVTVAFSVAGQPRKLEGVVASFGSDVNARGQVRVQLRIANQREGGRWLLFHGKTVTITLAP